MNKKLCYILLGIGMGVSSCTHNKSSGLIDVDKQLTYCHHQITRTLSELPDTCLMPRSMDDNQTKWNLASIYDWTSGFWPGILWLDYEATGDEAIKQQAIRYTECLRPLANPNHGGDHDIGFQLFNSFGNAYRLTGDESYKEAILAGAKNLSRLYNPTVGTILSWPVMVERMGWPHNTIMDNMMNLEILFWAAKNGGDANFYDMAERHARVTMENGFSADGANYHVAVYDTISGKFLKGVTNQGYGDNTMWARGQAWAIHGFTMVYRETGDKIYLRFAEKISDVYLKRLPEDYVPYWDFDDPAIPNAPKDASAAAIAAAGLLELSKLEDDKEKSKEYLDAATRMLQALSSEGYQSGELKPSFLRHATGNYPGGYEIDASINYGDYYYLQGLMRWRE